MTDDQDWSWRGDPARGHTKLWTATKEGRRAELWARQHPLGQEVCCYFGDRFLWSVVVRPDDDRQLDEIADQHRKVWIAKGWAITK